MNANISQALLLLVQGMVGIFVVLGVIALLVTFLQKWDRRGRQ